jgi:hypothetical protein
MQDTCGSLSLGNLEEERSLGRLVRREECSIEKDLKEIECGALNWIQVAYDCSGVQ